MSSSRRHPPRTSSSSPSASKRGTAPFSGSPRKSASEVAFLKKRGRTPFRGVLLTKPAKCAGIFAIDSRAAAHRRHDSEKGAVPLFRKWGRTPFSLGAQGDQGIDRCGAARRHE